MDRVSALAAVEEVAILHAPVIDLIMALKAQSIDPCYWPRVVAAHFRLEYDQAEALVHGANLERTRCAAFEMFSKLSQHPVETLIASFSRQTGVSLEKLRYWHSLWLGVNAEPDDVVFLRPAAVLAPMPPDLNDRAVYMEANTLEQLRRLDSAVIRTRSFKPAPVYPLLPSLECDRHVSEEELQEASAASYEGEKELGLPIVDFSKHNDAALDRIIAASGFPVLRESRLLLRAVNFDVLDGELLITLKPGVETIGHRFPLRVGVERLDPVAYVLANYSLMEWGNRTIVVHSVVDHGTLIADLTLARHVDACNGVRGAYAFEFPDGFFFSPGRLTPNPTFYRALIIRTVDDHRFKYLTMKLRELNEGSYVTVTWTDFDKYYQQQTVDYLGKPMWIIGGQGWTIAVADALFELVLDVLERRGVRIVYWSSAHVRDVSRRRPELVTISVQTFWPNVPFVSVVRGALGYDLQMAWDNPHNTEMLWLWQMTTVASLYELAYFTVFGPGGIAAAEIDLFGGPLRDLHILRYMIPRHEVFKGDDLALLKSATVIDYKEIGVLGRRAPFFKRPKVYSTHFDVDVLTEALPSLGCECGEVYGCGGTHCWATAGTACGVLDIADVVRSLPPVHGCPPIVARALEMLQTDEDNSASIRFDDRRGDIPL